MTELKNERTRTRKVLASLAAVTMVGVAGVAGTTAALSDTTSSTVNNFDAATIDLSDNNTGTFMYDVDDMEYAVDTVERCIEITYDGNRDAEVGLYMPTALSAGAEYIDLKVEVGTDPSVSYSSTDDTGCVGFSPDATDGVLYDAKLSDFQTSHSAWGTSLKAGPNGVDAASGDWEDGNTAVYKVTLELNTSNELLANGSTSGAHTFTWRAESV